MLALSELGLSNHYQAGRGTFVHTARPASGGHEGLVLQGVNLRYAAICALGLAQLPVERQRAVLAGVSAAQLAERTVELADASPDPGVWALTLWAAAELGVTDRGKLHDRVRELVASGEPIETVVAAWALTALIAARPEPFAGTDRELARELAARLQAAQGSRGVFPHVIPASTQSAVRRHVGCFADQVYPIQALARWSVVTGEADALAAANLCAQRICQLQGPAGQWWWHYDVRTGEVVEGYPVYSVHQHAMAPMALNELREAGGFDLTSAVARGVDWIAEHPELPRVGLIDRANGMIWRSIRRREPVRASRRAKAVLTAVRPGVSTGLLGRVAPPVRLDQECRPYELGWLLYAWLADLSDCIELEG